MSDEVQEKIVSASAHDKFIFPITDQSTEMFGYNFGFPSDNFNIQLNKVDVALGVCLVLGLPILAVLGKFGIGFDKTKLNHNKKHPYLSNHEILDGAFNYYNNSQHAGYKDESNYNEIDDGKNGFFDSYFQKVEKVRQKFLKHMNKFSESFTGIFKKFRFKKPGNSKKQPEKNPYDRDVVDGGNIYRRPYVAGSQGYRPVLGLGESIGDYFAQDPYLESLQYNPELHRDSEHDNSWSGYTHDKNRYKADGNRYHHRNIYKADHDRYTDFERYSEDDRYLSDQSYENQDYLKRSDTPNYGSQDYHMEYQDNRGTGYGEEHQENRRPGYGDSIQETQHYPNQEYSSVKEVDVNNNNYDDSQYFYNQEHDFKRIKTQSDIVKPNNNDYNYDKVDSSDNNYNTNNDNVQNENKNEDNKQSSTQEKSKKNPRRVIQRKRKNYQNQNQKENE